MEMAHPARFERATSAFGGQHSIQPNRTNSSIRSVA
jgi:hypothetical protein